VVGGAALAEDGRHRNVERALAIEPVFTNRARIRSPFPIEKFVGRDAVSVPRRMVQRTILCRTILHPPRARAHCNGAVHPRRSYSWGGTISNSRTV